MRINLSLYLSANNFGRRLWAVPRKLSMRNFLNRRNKDMTWQKIKADLDQENERILNEPCEDVVKLLHYRIIDSRAGTDGQALSAWFFGCTDVRYIVAYLFDLIRFASDPRYTTHQLKFMAKTMIPPLGEFAGYAGFPKL